MSELRPNTFKIVQLNAENLFIFLDQTFLVTPSSRDWRQMSEKDWQKLSRSTVSNKQLLKVLWLAESLRHIDADLICLNEVGGLESIANFSKYFLDDLYEPHLIEGNSNRGIDIGFLLRRSLPVRAELRSHKDRPIDFLYPHEPSTAKSHGFSRDCAELRLFPRSTTPDPNLRPWLTVLLVHLKSKLDPDGIDPQGKDRRRAEFNMLLKIYREVRAEFSPAVPVVVAGDFNGRARPDSRDGKIGEEFAELANSDLESCVELAGLSDEAAATQLQFHRGGHVVGLQIDYVFISPDLKPRLRQQDVQVYRYHSDLRVQLPLPTTLDQRLKMPSDHYPVVVSFDSLDT